MPRTLFTNVLIFDGTGKSSYPGEVLLQGNRIKAVVKAKDQIDRSLAEEIVDGGGATLMPGLTEGHGHLSYTNCAALRDIGNVPVEEHMLLTSYNARPMLDSGFTSAQIGPRSRRPST